MMISVWWVAAAFLLGGCAGFVVFALMAMASHEREHASRAEETVAREGLGEVGLDRTWNAE